MADAWNVVLMAVTNEILELGVGNLAWRPAINMTTSSALNILQACTLTVANMMTETLWLCVTFAKQSGSVALLVDTFHKNGRQSCEVNDL
jgi:hypothetical protein